MQEYLPTLIPVICLILGLVIGYFVKSFSADNQIALFRSELEQYAQKSLDKKSESLDKISGERLGAMLTPLNQRIQDFDKLVKDSFQTQGKDVMHLKGEIQNIIKANEKITKQASDLTTALKGDVQVQGTWGEVILEKILEESGLRKGEDYITQGEDMSLKHSDTGGHLKPDVIIKLPENKHIIVDSKINLKHYEEYTSVETDVEQQLKLNSFLTALKEQVKGLEKKKYSEADGMEGTPDFVLMFVPIEGAYSLAMQTDKDLHSFAWDKKVAITCPSTLMIALKTIASFWRIDQQNKNAMEIAQQAGFMYDKFVLFSESILGVEKGLDNARTSYEKAINQLSTGKGNLVARAEKLKNLGVKYSKELDSKLTDESKSSEKG